MVILYLFGHRLLQFSGHVFKFFINEAFVVIIRIEYYPNKKDSARDVELINEIDN